LVTDGASALEDSFVVPDAALADLLVELRGPTGASLGGPTTVPASSYRLDNTFRATADSHRAASGAMVCATPQRLVMRPGWIERSAPPEAEDLSA
jgi:hypothetical protein